jgi:hypothetical protein
MKSIQLSYIPTSAQGYTAKIFLKKHKSGGWLTSANRFGRAPAPLILGAMAGDEMAGRAPALIEREGAGQYELGERRARVRSRRGLPASLPSDAGGSIWTVGAPLRSSRSSEGAGGGARVALGELEKDASGLLLPDLGRR